MKMTSEGHHFSRRAVVSTLFGEGVDSLIFFPFAFGGLISFHDLVKLMILQVITKTMYEIIALPLTIRVVRWVKRREGTDVYDRDETYNPINIFQL